MPILYLTVGLTSMVFKYALDAGLIFMVTRIVWTPWQYLTPSLNTRAAFAAEASWLLPVLGVLTLPFLWIGLTMSVRRANDAARMPTLGVLFLLPGINYLAMLLLAVIPSEPGRPLGDYTLIADSPRTPFIRAAIVGAAIGAAIGIAYPMRARIEGTGVGAARYCEFSNGAFVEPITRWEPPARLSFEVQSQPVSMHEMSSYRHLHPPHLDGHFHSRRGEFRLASLPAGRGPSSIERRSHPGRAITVQ